MDSPAKPLGQLHSLVPTQRLELARKHKRQAREALGGAFGYRLASGVFGSGGSSSSECSKAVPVISIPASFTDRYGATWFSLLGLWLWFWLVVHLFSFCWFRFRLDWLFG